MGIAECELTAAKVSRWPAIHAREDNNPLLLCVLLRHRYSNLHGSLTRQSRSPIGTGVKNAQVERFPPRHFLLRGASEANQLAARSVFGH